VTQETEIHVSTSGSIDLGHIAQKLGVQVVRVRYALFNVCGYSQWNMKVVHPIRPLPIQLVNENYVNNNELQDYSKAGVLRVIGEYIDDVSLRSCLRNKEVRKREKWRRLPA
jgi:hypothetical protein